MCPIYSIVVQRKQFPSYEWQMFGYILLTSFLLFMVTSLFNYSMKYITASMSSVIIYLSIPVSYILDYLFLGSQVGWLEMIGVCLIVIINVLLGYLKSKGLAG